MMVIVLRVMLVGLSSSTYTSVDAGHLGASLSER